MIPELLQYLSIYRENYLSKALNNATELKPDELKIEIMTVVEIDKIMNLIKNFVEDYNKRN